MRYLVGWHHPIDGRQMSVVEEGYIILVVLVCRFSRQECVGLVHDRLCTRPLMNQEGGPLPVELRPFWTCSAVAGLWALSSACPMRTATVPKELVRAVVEEWCVYGEYGEGQWEDEDYSSDTEY